MSAGICGKRLGFEEIFGSPSLAPSAKRSRCSRFDSSVRTPEFGLSPEDKASILAGLFPSMDREVIETVLKNHDLKIDDAIKSLHALCLGDGSMGIGSLQFNSEIHANGCSLEGGTNSEASELTFEGSKNNCLDPQNNMPKDASSWSDILVVEMKNASNWDDVRCRATRILDAFEKGIVAQTTASLEQENHTFKEQLQCLLKDNHILKRAIAIQHERSIEHEEKLKEIQQLKHFISQYQEQVGALELNNYTLRIHLQKAQEANSIPDQFHPDIF